MQRTITRYPAADYAPSPLGRRKSLASFACSYHSPRPDDTKWQQDGSLVVAGNAMDEARVVTPEPGEAARIYSYQETTG